jgi:hypothetical protein
MATAGRSTSSSVPGPRTELRHVVIVGRDLMMATRIADAATAAGVGATRVDDPGQLPAAADIGLIFVDWDDRQPGWAPGLRQWRDAAGEAAPRVLLFGSHRDVAGHREARANGLGPMLARSKLVASLQSLLRG